MSAMAKVFGIGLNKTGTTTLGECLKVLGFSHASRSRKLLEDVRVRNDLTDVFRTVDRFDSFEDWPYPLIYRELDERYPNSKFILTVRKDKFIWLESLKKHSLRTRPLSHSRALAYGFHYPFGHEREHVDLYEHHNKKVVEYFEDRASDLLVLCWENGDGWPELCAFLGRDQPDLPLPHANRQDVSPSGLLTKANMAVNRVLSRVL